MKNNSVLPQPTRAGKTLTQDLSAFPIRSAFVIQFAAEADVMVGQWNGWVEHVRSGQSTHFHSLDDLLTFITRVLTDIRRQAEEDC